ncbi:hypothetical protein ACHAXN_000584, partial [Cyclotella atomus]
DLIDMNKYVTLVGDVMFVCGLPFLITLSRRIQFVTLQYLPNRSAKELKSGLLNVAKLYNRAGFIIQAAVMDCEFEPLVKLLLDKTVVNTTAKNEHVGEIERKIQHVKNRGRSTKASLPYKALPKAVIKALLKNVVLWMNVLLSKQGISTEYSPQELVLRRQLDPDKHAQWSFGVFGEAHDDLDRTNTMQERTKSCINLGPTGNFQGTHQFLNLETGEIIKRKKFTMLPMPDSMIKRVEELARQDGQSRRNRLLFRNQNGERFDWDEDDDEEPLVDDNAVEAEPPAAQFPSIPAKFPGIPLERDVPVSAIAEEPGPSEEEQAERAVANTNIGPNLIPDERAGDDRSDAYIQQLRQLLFDDANDANAAGQPTIVDDDEVPPLMRRGEGDDPDSSDDEDDETYKCSEQEDGELVLEDQDHTSAQDHRSAEHRSADNESGRTTRTRRVKVPGRFKDFQMLQA